MHKGFNLNATQEEIRAVFLEIISIGWRGMEKCPDEQFKLSIRGSLEEIIKSYQKIKWTTNA